MAGRAHVGSLDLLGPIIVGSGGLFLLRQPEILHEGPELVEADILTAKEDDAVFDQRLAHDGNGLRVHRGAHVHAADNSADTAGNALYRDFLCRIHIGIAASALKLSPMRTVRCAPISKIGFLYHKLSQKRRLRNQPHRQQICSRVQICRVQRLGGPVSAEIGHYLPFSAACAAARRAIGTR